MTKNSTAHETFVIERVYDVPVADTFRAWADPAIKARWFAASVDEPDCEYALDFRVGGREINHGRPPGGPLYTYESVYRDIVAEQRIVYTYEMHADDTLLSVSVATVEFRSKDASTQLILTEQGVFLDGHDTSAQREEGTRQLMESLAIVLK
jgi:uncharacterized protein YndB with AHSA1/START domain